jgi:hypothetical protein
MLAGWLRGEMNMLERTLYGVLSIALILAPLGIAMRAGALVAFAALLVWSNRVRPAAASRGSPA